MPYLKSGKNKLFYRSIGAGLPVILISGLATNYRVWGFQFLELKNSFKLIAFDNRGFGKSNDKIENLTIEDLALDIDNLLNEIGVERVCLLGTSLGD